MNVERILSVFDVVDLIQSSTLAVAGLFLVFSNFEALRARYFPYGARSEHISSTKGAKQGGLAASKTGHSLSLFDRVMETIVISWNVPHGYFVHFYMLSVFWSLLWAFQLATRGALFRLIAAGIHERHLKHTMTLSQVLLCWTLLMAQGLRRLYECVTLARPSTSRMGLPHWFLGLGFYTMMNIAIWIEGAATILSSEMTLVNLKVTAPSMRTLLFLPVFLIASGIQHDCHRYLASLKKYTLPQHPAFLRIVCPHYTAECAIYLAFAFLAAPEGHVVNQTLLVAFLFVIANLGASAGIAYEWYARKFGEDKVKLKWKMIPGVN